MEIFLGFFVGLLASWLFWKYLLILKPNLMVEDLVVETATANGGQCLEIGCENVGKRQIIDISIRATVCELHAPGTKNPLRLVTRLKMEIDRADVLNPARKDKENDWSLPSYRKFHVLPIDENTGNEIDFRELIKDENRRLIFTIRATDAVSSTTTVCRKTFTVSQINFAQQVAPADPPLATLAPVG